MREIEAGKGWVEKGGLGRWGRGRMEREVREEVEKEEEEEGSVEECCSAREVGLRAACWRCQEWVPEGVW